ncbi:MAG: DUF4838 domain-containing protein [Candidatus Hydrogenedentes bacterium]|nr:DUF4838 domain-containing protein [Candidatus Hydrogenedentota bacterium]
MTKLYPLITLSLTLLAAMSVPAAEPSSTYLRDWLLLGPIATEGKLPEAGDLFHLQGFDRNYFEAQGEEGAVKPVAGQKVVFPGGEAVWTAHNSSTDDVNLSAIFGKIDLNLAYAFTEIKSDADTAAVLSLGSNDGCRVWLNGEVVFDHAGARGLVLDGDQVPVLLKKGSNALLIKVEDQGNDWGFSCRFLPFAQDDFSSRINLFEAGQKGEEPASLTFTAPASLLGNVVLGADLELRRATDQTVLWTGPWNVNEVMELPVDSSEFGQYVLNVKTKLAGSLAAYYSMAFTAGTPVDHPLFANGASDYVIAVDAAASESEVWAAKELQHWLAEISGVTLPVVAPGEVGEKPAIAIGWNDLTAKLAEKDAKAPEVHDESFIYHNNGANIAIYGGSQRGTMYGVMAFLENELGVRFYTPKVTVAPKRESYAFRLLRFADKPGIRVRNDFYFEAFDPIWAAHNRGNGAMGTRVQPGGVEGYWAVHTFYPLLPPEEFFEAHPEWYSLIDGERTHDRAQLCLTNPEVLDMLTERLKQRMRENPDNLIYCVSQNDWHGACQCDNCQAIATREESEAGPVVWFVNQVAERIEKELPDKYVGTLAYQYTRKPPKTIKPRDNVVIRFCSIECCFAHDFLTCPQNVSFVEDMKGWAAKAKNIYIWDYVVSFSNYVMPFPNFAVLQPNIQTLRDHNAIGIMEQAAYQSRGGDFSELKAYLISKLLWNPDVEVEPIIDDFMYGFYGRSGQYIREYFDLAQNLVTPDTHFMIWIQPNDPLYNEEFIKEAGAIFDQAERVADNPEILARVEMARLPLLYLKCRRTPKDAIRDGSYDRLLKIIERENVTHFAEAGQPHLEAFLAEMEAQR